MLQLAATAHLHIIPQMEFKAKTYYNKNFFWSRILRSAAEQNAN